MNKSTIRLLPAASVFFLVAAAPAKADEPPFLACAQKSAATWSRPAIDPIADLRNLLSDNGLIDPVVKDVKQENFEGDPQRPTCKAIVETANRGNFLYDFHYAKDESGQWRIAGIELEPLTSKLPTNINFAALAPFLPDAEAIINTYSRIYFASIDCNARSSAWRRTLFQDVLAAIPPERTDIAEDFKKDEDHAPLEGDLAPTRKECADRDHRKDFALGDKIVKGHHDIWSLPEGFND